ncbi:hypothetical protein C8Q80DRAFT_1193146 [Daedaleopsis nitida]|nr:hypothetical protein C8Q80DRAFT_1193146 [Daedaleopsis nitida]
MQFRLVGGTSEYVKVTVAISPDSRHVAVAGHRYDSGIVRLYSIAYRCCVGFIRRRHTVDITVLQFTPDGNTLCSSDRNGVVWFTYIGYLLSHSPHRSSA